MPEISIIVPVYKTEKYLRRCIDSILAQTFTDFELILVDDGSPDNCPKICDEYAEMDSRVRVIHQENGGVSSARNKGLDNARGKYIMFCDSDDYVDPSWCSQYYQAILWYPNAWIVGDIIRGTYNKDNGLKNKIKTNEGKLNYFDIYISGLSAYSCNKIYSKDILNANGIRYDIKIHISEDVVFNIEYYKCCQQVFYISEQLYYYCDNSDSVMNRYSPDMFEKMLLPYYVRLSVIPVEFIPEYCDIWLYQFMQLFDNVFDSRNHQNLFKKLSYNNKMIQKKEFIHCLDNATGKNENPLTIRILKTHNYYLYWLFNQIVKLKQKLKGTLTK